MVKRKFSQAFARNAFRRNVMRRTGGVIARGAARGLSRFAGPVGIAAGLGYAGYRYLKGRSQADNADGAPADVTSTYKQFSKPYTAKRYGKRQRRQGKQLQRFKYCWSKLQGKKSLTLQNRIILSSASNSSVFGGVIALNGISNHHGADYGFGDIAAIKDIILTSGATLQKQRFMVDKVVLDLWVRNIGTGTAFVELYEYALRKDLEADLGNDIATIFQNLQTNTVRSVGVAEGLTSLGWSPFEVSEICKKFKILKIHRFQLASGANASFKRMYSRKYIPLVEDLIAGGTSPFTGRKGHFKGFFARVAGDQNSTEEAAPASVTFLSRRTYYYSTLFDSYNDQGGAVPLIP